MDDVGSSDGGASQAREMGSRGASTPWEPIQLVFRRYNSPKDPDSKAQPLRAVVKKPLVVALTRDLVETYQICNPQFKYSGELNLKRYLTSPSVGVLNDGCDNVNSDLILAVNDVLVSSDSRQRYIIRDLLGHGTFGQVARCWVPETNSFVAVKVIKNQPAYYQQALVEVSILTTLNKKHDPEDKNHIVRIYDYFIHQRHLCICFELLDMNLYELIKMNKFKGLSLHIVQLFSKQILRGLTVLKDAGIIHCDLKPENILLCTSSVKPPEIKIIDFGSACMEDRTVYSYIQSRYYRSPEVLLGYRYTTAIDMWSFGCIVAELFLGLPLFPGASEFDLMRRMAKILGEQPPDYVLKEAKNTNKFFKCVGSVLNLKNGEISGGPRSSYLALTEEEFEAREKKKSAIGKEYFSHKNLEAIVKSYPYKTNLPEDDVVKETQIRLALIDFLRGLVEFDPDKRWSPLQASKHPFITGEPFTCPYKPPPETPHVYVDRSIKVDHHPGAGHWFAAGLSPHVAGRTTIPIHNYPHFQMGPYSQTNNYGSIGSYGSHSDGTRLGNSYGNYVETSNMFAYYSPVNHSGLNMHNRGGVSMLGSSPDARRMVMQQHQHGSALGVSPSAGNFAAFPLGNSPSQFTPPNSNNQLSAGYYGPTSPVRNSCHGSPLGKMTASSQFNRRKSVGNSGGSWSQDAALPQSQGQGMDNYIQSEGIAAQNSGSPSRLQSNASYRTHRKTQGSTTFSTGGSTQAGSSPGSYIYTPSGSGSYRENPDTGLSVPDPGDWDPNYSEELLLQEDSTCESSLGNAFSRGMHLGLAGASNSSRSLNTSTSTSSSNHPITQRRHGHGQGFSQADIGSPPAYEQHSRFGQFMPTTHFAPHVSQNSPSRLGQQPAPRYNSQGRQNAGRGTDWNHIKPQLPPVNSKSGVSPRSNSYTDGVTWGRKTNEHQVPSTSSHGRMDYGSIA